MIELDSEINTKYKKLKNYLKKNNVVEAKLRLSNGVIITYSQPSVYRTLLDAIQIIPNKKKHFKRKKLKEQK